ncbi:MAG: hypothetical protein RH917_06910 [Lacipirellulaceae bacterium]
MVTANTIDRFLGFDTQKFSPDMANAILAFQATNEVQQRVQELAEKANFGTLTEEERSEYFQYIELDEVLMIAKARARKYLAKQV